jgi:hypothetical protein
MMTSSLRSGRSSSSYYRIIICIRYSTLSEEYGVAVKRLWCVRFAGGCYIAANGGGLYYISVSETNPEGGLWMTDTIQCQQQHDYPAMTMVVGRTQLCSLIVLCDIVLANPGVHYFQLGVFKYSHRTSLPSK